MKAELSTKTYIRCPACGVGEFQVCHLFERPGSSFGPWYCDRCGTGYRGKVVSPGDVEIEPCSESPLRKVVDVLVLEPQEQPLYLALSSRDYGQGMEGKRYYYEEHTCPTNWTRDVEMLLIDGDSDPHGLFQFLGSRVVPDDFFDDANNDADVAKIIEAVKAAAESKEGDRSENPGMVE